ncbi:MAG: YbhB/YbcL family Raf kinase inhibitor-like protein [Thermoprotei archaeon]
MQLTFPFQGRFPDEFTCRGANVSPPFSWNSVPGAKAYALTVEDPDAPSGTFVHWVLYDVEGGKTSLPRSVPKRDRVQGIGIQGVNDFGNIGYDGPCPPRGHGDHRYFFTLYALSVATGLPPGVDAKRLKQAIGSLILDKGEFVAVYSRT